ncbi:MAG: OmpA family protein [Microcoleaceae cyanobacterium]
MTESLEAKRQRRRRKPQGEPSKSQGKPVAALAKLLFDLLLLTVGSGLAWIVGMAIAQIYPNPSSEMPLVEKWLRRSRPVQPAALSLPSATIPSSSGVTPPPSLVPEQRQQLQGQLQQLQKELNTLMGRTAALEVQLGISRPNDPLEQRLQSIDQQLTTLESPQDSAEDAAEDAAENNGTPLDTTGANSDGSGSILSNDAANSSSASPQLQSTAQNTAQNLVITLPSDILFEPGSSTLRRGANVILDNLISDLELYPDASIRVSGHTDATEQVQDNLTLSLQQAEAVVRYLSEAVVGEGYHWVAVGYGESYPVVSRQSEADQQLNRRIEVGIDP